MSGLLHLRPHPSLDHAHHILAEFRNRRLERYCACLRLLFEISWNEHLYPRSFCLHSLISERQLYHQLHYPLGSRD